ncbi:hypothetical protein LCGC14_2016420 [marine sediment metagenome]|uniref:Uncharacterized protein n=1 Tax=marine sediment metagenome TaxID=412755 RepID=A0A0F9HW07_9ZZZZ
MSDYNRIDGAALDRYITGNYGEDFECLDYEKGSDIPCPKCGGETMEQGYHGDRWIYCDECDFTKTIEDDPGDDPDRKYDEERDRRMLDE